MVGRPAESGEEVLYAVMCNEPPVVEGNCGKFTSQLTLLPLGDDLLPMNGYLALHHKRPQCRS